MPTLFPKNFFKVRVKMYRRNACHIYGLKQAEKPAVWEDMALISPSLEADGDK